MGLKETVSVGDCEMVVEGLLDRVTVGADVEDGVIEGLGSAP